MVSQHLEIAIKKADKLKKQTPLLGFDAKLISTQGVLIAAILRLRFQKTQWFLGLLLTECINYLYKCFLLDKSGI